MYKGPMDKAKGRRIEGGSWGWVEWGKVVVGKWRQLYSNNNKKRLKKNRHSVKSLLSQRAWAVTFVVV